MTGGSPIERRTIVMRVAVFRRLWIKVIGPERPCKTRSGPSGYADCGQVDGAHEECKVRMESVFTNTAGMKHSITANISHHERCESWIRKLLL